MKTHSLPTLLRAATLRLLLLGCAVLCFAAAVWWDNAANRGVSPRPASPIPFTDVPRGGVNTYNLHAEVVFRPDGSLDPENKVKRTFEMIAAAGLHWVRVQFPWEDIEICAKGDFRDCRHNNADAWIKYDYIVEQAERNGLELIVRLDTPPRWARERFLATPEVQQGLTVDPILTGPPDDLADYGDFVAAVAARYEGRLRFFQIWNEPNLLREWNYHRQDPAQLVEMLRIARERITAVSPDAVILFPALAPTDGRSDGINDLEYLQGVYDAGGRAFFDIMSAQMYGLGQPPSEHRYIKPGDSWRRPIETKVDIGRVVLLREVMERNGDSHKAVWVSEFGWNSAPPSIPEPARSTWGAPVSEETKGEYIVQAMERAEREWPWMGPMCVWMFRWGGEPPNPADPTPYFQLVDFEFNPQPAYTAIKNHLTNPSPTPAPAQRNPVAAAAPAIGGGLVLAAAVWTMPALGAVIAALESLSRARRRRIVARVSRVGTLPFVRSNRIMLALLTGSLLVFYVGSAQLPITVLGGAIFLGLALLRPDLALLFVPITVPLYLAPKGVWDERFGIRPSGVLFPLHEFVLMCVVVGTSFRLPASGFRLLRTHDSQRPATSDRPSSDDHRSWSVVWPIALFLLAGTVGVLVAAARGSALREWRWLIVEPLIFYALVRFWAQDEQRRRWLIGAWLLTGVGLACIGLIQLGGINMAALLPNSGCFSDRVVLAEGGLRRISAVYCHPNNLGLALGRVLPVLAAMSLVAATSHWRSLTQAPRRVWLLVAATPLCGLALGATFSKGAFLGAFVALVVLGVILRRRRNPAGAVVLVAASIGVTGVLALGLIFGVERLNPLGGSSGARVELWQSALQMIRDHPLTGVGLDQFYHYRTAPEFGDRYIDPAERTTTEQYAAHPHTLVLDLLVRVGPLGLLALAWLVLHFFRQCHRVRPESAYESALVIGLIASMCAALTHGLVDNFYFVPDLAFSFWLLLGLVDTLAASHHRAGQPNAESENHYGPTSIQRRPAPAHVGADRP